MELHLRSILCLRGVHIDNFAVRRLHFKCDGTRAETRFRLSAKRTSPFKSEEASVQSTTGRRAADISLQGLGCPCKPVFCSHVTLIGYPLLLFPFHFPSHASPCAITFQLDSIFYYYSATWSNLKQLGSVPASCRPHINIGTSIIRTVGYLKEERQALQSSYVTSRGHFRGNFQNSAQNQNCWKHPRNIKYFIIHLIHSIIWIIGLLKTH